MAQYQCKQELIHFSPCLCFSKMQASPGHIKGAGFILSQLREEITRNKVHQVKPNDKQYHASRSDLLLQRSVKLHVLTTPICMPNDAENNPALFSFEKNKKVYF